MLRGKGPAGPPARRPASAVVPRKKKAVHLYIRFLFSTSIMEMRTSTLSREPAHIQDAVPVAISCPQFGVQLPLERGPPPVPVEVGGSRESDAGIGRGDTGGDRLGDIWHTVGLEHMPWRVAARPPVAPFGHTNNKREGGMRGAPGRLG